MNNKTFSIDSMDALDFILMACTNAMSTLAFIRYNNMMKNKVLDDKEISIYIKNIEDGLKLSRKFIEALVDTAENEEQRMAAKGLYPIYNATVQQFNSINH